MHIKLIIRQYVWLLLFPLLTGCGPVAASTPTATVIAVGTPTSLNMDSIATQIAGTVVAQITQTAYRTPIETLPPTSTPAPTQTPQPVYALDGKRKASIIDGNLYVQNGDGKNVQLTDSKADSNPFFSDDGQKIVFYRWNDNSFYSIDANGSKEKQIIRVPSLAVQGGGKIKALAFIRNTHILLFNIYICGEPGTYAAGNCFVSTYSVNADSGETEEIGQRVSGTGFDERNFEISPNQKYLSIAGSGHINIFSFSAGHFKLLHFGAFAYSMTSVYEFLPYQYWLPDSSGLLIVSAKAGTSNAPPDPPYFYDVFRYTLGQKAVQIDDIRPRLGTIWRMGCVVSVSPDLNWIIFMGEADKIYLGNLKDGSSQPYDLDVSCFSIKWSPDNKHFAVGNLRYGRIGSVDGGPLIKLNGSFEKWIDATHYSYSIEGSSPDMVYVAEIGDDSVLFPSPTPTP